MGVEGLHQTLKVNDEFQREGIESALQPSAMLWHFWRSLSNLRDLKLESPADEPQDPEPQDPNGKRGAPEGASEQPEKKTKLGTQSKKKQKGQQRDVSSTEQPTLNAGEYRCPDPHCSHKMKKQPVKNIVDHM